MSPNEPRMTALVPRGRLRRIGQDSLPLGVFNRPAIGIAVMHLGA